jgi:hypothetical protein
MRVLYAARTRLEYYFNIVKDFRTAYVCACAANCAVRNAQFEIRRRNVFGVLTFSDSNHVRVQGTAGKIRIAVFISSCGVV